MLVTVAARLPVEWLLKEIVQRPRPSGARLVAGTGFAYPSGHVLAAAATWGLVPIIGGLYLKRRWLWWALSALTWTLIGAIAWTRVWLGVHWTSDVIGGLAIAFVALSLAEHTLDRRHADTGSSRCAGQAPPRMPPVPLSASPLEGPHRRDRNTRHAHEVTDFDAVARPRRDKHEHRTDRSARRRRAVTVRRARVMSSPAVAGVGTHADRRTRPCPRTAAGRQPPTPVSRPERCALTDRRTRWSDPAPGSLPDSEDGPVQPRTVPQRVVHAKGTGAHGFFECTADGSSFTNTTLFQATLPS